MITSTSNSKVKYVRRLQADRRFREREQAFVVEGTRWLSELIRLAYPPQLVLYTNAWHNKREHASILQQLDGPAQATAPTEGMVPAQAVSEEVMAAMSDTATPPGILAVLAMQPHPLPPSPTLLLVLDRVRTPGNLGTMLRTAAAAGAEGVLLGPGCVDPYNPKVVRGGMGAHLRLPIHRLSWPEIRSKTEKLAVWVAAADGDLPYSDVNWRQPSALIIGSEATGAGERAEATAGGRVYIPMHAATESLNAAMAAGVILFEAARQRRT